MELLRFITAIAFWVWAFQIFAATRHVVTNTALVAIGAIMVRLMLLTTAFYKLIKVVKEVW
ncbi:MAG: hypothetical protein QXZ68_03140 [Candidatus Bathyarchaeia archaeon]